MPGREAPHRELFTRLTYVEWDGAGHFLTMEKPAEFNQTRVESGSTGTAAVAHAVYNVTLYVGMAL